MRQVVQKRKRESFRCLSDDSSKGEMQMIRQHRQRGGRVTLLDADSQRRIADLCQGRSIADAIALADHQNEVKIIPVTAALSLGRQREVNFAINHGERGEPLTESLVREGLLRNLVTDVEFDLGSSRDPPVSEPPTCG